MSVSFGVSAYGEQQMSKIHLPLTTAVEGEEDIWLLAKIEAKVGVLIGGCL